MVTLDEAGDEEEKPDEAQTEETSRSAKRKHDDETGGCYSISISVSIFI